MNLPKLLKKHEKKEAMSVCKKMKFLCTYRKYVVSAWILELGRSRRLLGHRPENPDIVITKDLSYDSIRALKVMRGENT